MDRIQYNCPMSSIKKTKDSGHGLRKSICCNDHQGPGSGSMTARLHRAALAALTTLALAALFLMALALRKL